jgi:hypothetical protein
MHFVLPVSIAMQRQKSIYIILLMSLLPGSSAWQSGEGIKNYEEIL